MIKKIIACSDIHIRGLKRLDEAGDVMERFINMAREEIKDNPEECRIVVAGDIFENKISITNEGIVMVHWFLKQLNGLAKTYVIAGNHDYLASNTDRMDSLTPMFSMGEFNNVVYLDKELDFQSGYYEDDNIIWCLYSTFDGFTRPNIEKIKRDFPNHKYIGLVHGDINGAKTDVGFVTDKGMNTSVFKGLDFVIAGHIHKHQALKYGKTQIVYCSSLIQQNNGENISGHGYVLWDVENNSYEFKEVPNPEFGYYLFTIDNVEDIENNKEKLVNI